MNVAIQVPLTLDTLSAWSRGALHQRLQQDTLTFEDASVIWKCLLDSLGVHTLSEKHITSICNCLRIFLKDVSTIDHCRIRQLALSRSAWLGCYNAICTLWSRAKAKPLLQVLETLLETAKSGMSNDELVSMWEVVSFELTTVIVRGQPARELKRALALSAFFLGRGLSYETYHHSVGQVLAGHKRQYEDNLKSLLYAMLLSFEQREAQSSAQKLFKELLKTQKTSDLQPWWTLVQSFVADHADSLDVIALSVFPLLWNSESIRDLHAINSMCKWRTKHDIRFSLALLQSLRGEEKISQDDLIGILQQSSAAQITSGQDPVDLLLAHADDDVRVRSFRLLVASKMTNAPIAPSILLQLKNSIPLWFFPGGPQERGELLSIIRRLLIRLRGGSSVLNKHLNSHDHYRQWLNAHVNFLETLLTHTISALRPNASYQLHSMSLSVLRHLLDSKIDKWDRNTALGSDKAIAKHGNDPEWPFSLCLRTMSIAQDLLNLSCDAFEDVRALSSSILKQFLVTPSMTPPSLFFDQLHTALLFILPRLESQAAETNRSDHADGLGRLYALQHTAGQISPSSDGGDSSLVRLIDRLNHILLDHSTFEKPGPEPLHSLLLGVMYCVDTCDFEIKHSVIAICDQVWKGVSDRLCVDSPETETLDDEEPYEDTLTGPKDMLSYSWRALRDSSLLLRSLLTSPHGIKYVPDLEGLSLIGQLCMEQLTRLRHRGAFSTVAQTFTICCQRATEIQGQGLIGLRYQWYSEAEALVNRQADRLTRRSAGLPAMIAAILSAEDDESFQNFVETFTTKSQVKSIGQSDQGTLPQVHAMNALREVLINSRFRNAIASHLQNLLILATKNLGSNIWAIRNCGLMLYRACLLRLSGRLEGVTTNKDAANPEIESSSVQLVTQLLGQDHDGHESSGVEQQFAAIDMVAHIFVVGDVNYDPSTHLLPLLSNSVWLIRERAAEVIASFVTPERLQWEFKHCLETVKTAKMQNKLHGTLLFGRQVLKKWLARTRSSNLIDVIDQVLHDLQDLMINVRSRVLAPAVWAVIFEIANDVSEKSLATDLRTNFSLLEYTELLRKPEVCENYLPATAFAYNIILNLILLGGKVGEPETTKTFSALIDLLAIDSGTVKEALSRMLDHGFVLRSDELLLLWQALSQANDSYLLSLLYDALSLSAQRFPLQWNFERAYQLFDSFDSFLENREFSAGSLMLQATLLRQILPKQRDCEKVDFGVSRHRFRFERLLKRAARDEMDAFVRLHATKALSEYLLALPLDGFGGFELLYTLHDLLNDDDEDVRVFAADTASSFLCKVTGAAQIGSNIDGSCPSTASSRLEDYLLLHTSDDKIECEGLFRKLLKVDSNFTLVEHLQNFTVSEQLGVIRNGSRALFAVERQNLYIDEVREIRFWTSFYKEKAKLNSPMPEAIRVNLQSWVLNGIPALTALLKSAEQFPSMVPNETHNLEYLLLSLRTLSIAGICLSILESGISGDPLDSQKIRQELMDIKKLGSQCQFNPDFTRALNEALGLVTS